jgi:DNA-binding TFAR19-related protein (PDSD5 family)
VVFFYSIHIHIHIHTPQQQQQQQQKQEVIFSIATNKICLLDNNANARLTWVNLIKKSVMKFMKNQFDIIQLSRYKPEAQE